MARTMRQRSASGKPAQPLGEVFGNPPDNQSDQAVRSRVLRLCPFHNRSANCTKDKANDPLGVCSIVHGDTVTITCPVRFREQWLIAEHAASFFFEKDTPWTTLTEIRLRDANDAEVGNIDVVLVAYDDLGNVRDFGTIEIQGVYISGNIRRPFEEYMLEPSSPLNWSAERHYPRPDFLSSRKRLGPQVANKGGIIHHWGKKQAVVIDRYFFAELPALEQIDEESAEMVWLVYDLEYDAVHSVRNLVLVNRVFTAFSAAVAIVNSPPLPHSVDSFVDQLQQRLDRHLAGATASDITEILDVLDPSNEPVDPDQV